MNDCRSALVELRSVPGWQCRPATITSLRRGHNNRSYRIDSGDDSYVLRIANQADETAMRDFELETRIQQRGADRGIAASLLFVNPDRGVMLSEYLPGRAWSARDLQQGNNLERLAALLQTMHGLPLSGIGFAAAHAASRYLEVLQGANVLTDFALRCQRIVADTPRTGCRACCHNDVVAGNIVDDGRLMLIDFEYACDNDPLFDLASLIGWHNLEPGKAQRLLTAYCGSAAAEWQERLSLQLRLFDALQWLWLSARQTLRPEAAHRQQLQRVAERLA